MSPLTVHRAKRENIWLLLGLAGGTGSGKTWSAMAIAEGLAGGEPFGVLDTENGRASHYADDFTFDVVDLGPPFRPERYQEGIQALVDAGRKVIVVDSTTHEWDGVGGLLEWHDQETGGREANNLKGWIKPKMAHRKFVTYLLQVPAHVILCFRAAERVEVVEVDDPRNPGRKKKEIVPKRSLTGLDGWVPIAEKTLPFELTLSLLLVADQPGIPHPIKLQQQHRLMVPLDRLLDQETGRALGEWALGKAAEADPAAEELPALITELLELADELGARDSTTAAISKNRRRHARDLAKHADWLRSQIENARGAAEQRSAEPDEDLFTTAQTNLQEAPSGNDD